MPALSITGAPTRFGFAITASSTATVTGTKTVAAEIKKILDVFEANKLCKVSEETVGGAAWPSNSGRLLIVSTPTKQVADSILLAVQLLDNSRKFA